MTEELLDIFDRSGKKIGSAVWEEVHKKGYLHKVADGLIFKTKARETTLIQKRSLEVKQDAGLWMHAVGGHIRAGESPRKGILRELQEELFSGEKLPMLKTRKVCEYFSHDLPGNYEIVHMFEIIYSGPFFIGKQEVEKIRWVKWNILIEDMEKKPNKYTNFFHEMIKRYGKVREGLRIHS